MSRASKQKVECKRKCTEPESCVMYSQHLAKDCVVVSKERVCRRRCSLLAGFGCLVTE